MGSDHHKPIMKQDFEKMPEYNATEALFQEFGWDKFFNKFQGYNDQVTLAFSRGLQDCMAHVGDISMEVLGKIFSKATRLSTEGEHWSKNMTITKEQW